VDGSNPTATVMPQQLATDLTPLNVGYDACAATGSGGRTPAVIAWSTDHGTVVTAYVDPVGVIGSAITGWPAQNSVVFASTDNTNMSIAFDATQGIGVTAIDNTAPAQLTLHFDTSLSATFVRTANDVAVGVVLRTAASVWLGSSLFQIYEDTSGTTSERDTRLYGIDVAAVVALQPGFPLRGLSLASRAFIDNGVGYVYAVVDVPFFSIYLLVRLTDGAVIARTMPTIAHGTQVNGSSTWTSTVSIDPNDARRWRVPLLANEQLAALAGQFAETGIRWITLDFDDPNAWSSVQLGAGLYLAGACPQHYDSDRWAEAGFHYAPDGVIVTTPAVGSGALSAGLYTYVFWYEEIDALGEVHRGAVSIGTEVVVAGGQNQVTITGPMYRTTSRKRVRVCVARATVNTAIEFFRVASVVPTTAGAPANGYILNDPTVDSWTFVDRMSDTTLLGQDPIYTTGGVLSNDPPPMAGGVIAVGKNRLLWTDPFDSTLIRYSQQLAEGFAVDMAAPLKQSMDPFGGAVTAIGVLDDAIIPFRELAVYVISGPGPLPDPTQQTDTFSFTPAALVTSDVGCTEPASLVQTPIGLAFKTAKGFRLLGRDRKVIDIGEDARGFDAQGVTAATLMPKFSRIVFLTASGSTLLYDYQRGQWSRFSNHQGLDALILGNLYYYVRTDGRVFVETPGAYRDDNSHIPMVIEMAWLKMAGYLQGWQRIWYAQFIGEWRSAHTLRARYRLNYEQQWSAAIDMDVNSNFTATPYGAGAYGAGPYGSTGSSVYQRRIHIGKECQAIQFQLQDVELTADFGASFELSELVITGGLKGPLYKLGAARSS
jgi:hypothetical protein